MHSDLKLIIQFKQTLPRSVMLTASVLFSVNLALLGAVGVRLWRESNYQYYPFAVAFLGATDAITLLTMAALFFLYFTVMLLKRVFFGPTLRIVEEEHLREWGWMTASESLLAMTVFRNQFDSLFILTFAAVLAAKGMHWVAKDRSEMVEQSSRLPDNYHVRMAGCLAFLFFIDFVCFSVCIYQLSMNGPSMAILFASDFAIMLIGVISTACKYALAVYEQEKRREQDNFEVSIGGVDRSTLIFYFDFVVDLAKLTIYLSFFSTIIALYGLPLHLFRELYMAVASFVKRISDVIKYRRATQNMNSKYPDAKQEDLERVHSLCIICREELKLPERGEGMPLNRRPKVLPCGHTFHFRCLRSWLERQQACPTCRQSVLVKPTAGTSGANQRANQQPPTASAPTPNPTPTPTTGSSHPQQDNNQADTGSVSASIESLKKQMEELQRNVAETHQLLRSLSNSVSVANSNSDSNVPSLSGSLDAINPKSSSVNEVKDETPTERKKED